MGPLQEFELSRAQKTWPNAAVRSGVEHCQRAFVEAHFALYMSHSTPLLGQWAAALGCGSVDGYLQDGLVFIYARECSTGEVSGYVCATYLGPKNSGCDQLPVYWVNHLVVLPQHRGRAVGKLLLAEVVRTFGPRSDYSLQLLALDCNAPALRWYWHLGFVITGARRGQVGGRHKVVYLEMRLDSVLQPESAPLAALFLRHEVVGELLWDFRSTSTSSAKVPRLMQLADFDESSGLHRLADDSIIDLRSSFAAGDVLFDRPLYKVLARCTCCESHLGDSESVVVPWTSSVDASAEVKEKDSELQGGQPVQPKDAEASLKRASMQHCPGSGGLTLGKSALDESDCSACTRSRRLLSQCGVALQAKPPHKRSRHDTLQTLVQEAAAGDAPAPAAEEAVQEGPGLNRHDTPAPMPTPADPSAEVAAAALAGLREASMLSACPAERRAAHQAAFAVLRDARELGYEVSLSDLSDIIDELPSAAQEGGCMRLAGGSCHWRIIDPGGILGEKTMEHPRAERLGCLDDLPACLRLQRADPGPTRTDGPTPTQTLQSQLAASH